jgi:hypothetical protein
MQNDPGVQMTVFIIQNDKVVQVVMFIFLLTTTRVIAWAKFLGRSIAQPDQWTTL